MIDRTERRTDVKVDLQLSLLLESVFFFFPDLFTLNRMVSLAIDHLLYLVLCYYCMYIYIYIILAQTDSQLHCAGIIMIKTD